MNKFVRKKINIHDLDYILNNLRDVDYREAVTLCGKNFIKSQSDVIMQSNAKICVDEKTHKPVFVYGVCPAGNNAGSLFMLSTSEIALYKRCLIIEFKKEMIEFNKKYRFLFNLIYKENIGMKKLLKSAGFNFAPVLFGQLHAPKDFEYFFY